MRKRIFQTWFWMGFLALSGGPSMVFAQQEAVSLRMEVDKRQVEVGETLTLTIEFKQVAMGNASEVGSPEIPTPEHFEIRGNFVFNNVSINNQQTVSTTTTKIKLTATKAGMETLGPALLIYQNQQLKKQEVKSNVATVTVVEKSGFSIFGKKKNASPDPNQEPANPNPPATVPAPGDELRGLKPLLPESFPFVKLILLLAILGAIAVFVWRQLAKPVKKSSGPPLLGKVAQLRDAWKKLGNEDLSGEQFCLGLSGLVRECLQYRFNFSAVDYTTEEILKALKQYKISEDEAAAAEKCLKTCDRVLYADGNLTGRDNLRSLCSALLPKVSKN